jgi:hypothetical protein
MSARIRWQQVLATVGLASLLSWPSLLWTGTAWGKQEGQTSERGFPTRKVGGGTRCGLEAPCPYDVLVALIPDGLAATAEALPNFYFYIPPAEEASKPNRDGPLLEFVLRDESDRLVYEAIFSATSKGGIVPFQLPTSPRFQGLAVGQNYHWYLSIIYDPADRSYDDVVEGWIRRVAPQTELSEQLARATPLERVELLQAANLWYEALDTLAQLKQSRPDDPRVDQMWNQLLKDIELDQRLNQKPLLKTDFQPVITDN